MNNTNKALEEAVQLAKQLADKLNELNTAANAEKTSVGALLSLIVGDKIKAAKDIEIGIYLAQAAYNNDLK